MVSLLIIDSLPLDPDRSASSLKRLSYSASSSGTAGIRPSTVCGLNDGVLGGDEVGFDCFSRLGLGVIAILREEGQTSGLTRVRVSDNIFPTREGHCHGKDARDCHGQCVQIERDNIIDVELQV